MKVFSISFTGYYPVGGEGIVVADSKERALEVFIERINIECPGLLKDNNNITAEDFEEIDTSVESLIVLNNGDY